MTASKRPIAIERPMKNPTVATNGEHSPMRTARLRVRRLRLSHPTFYRRLQRGFALVAVRLDELSEFAQRVPVND